MAGLPNYLRLVWQDILAIVPLTATSTAPWDVTRYITRRMKVTLYRSAFQLGYRSELFDQTAAREELSSADSVLFLCHGNICRSPFAERYFESQLSTASISATSAGFHPEAGRQSPEAAIKAAAQHNVGLADHTSRVVSYELIRASDIVFLMDVRNYLSWKRNFGDQTLNPFFLGSPLMEGRDEFELRDPFGGDQAEFRSVYRDIADSIDRLLDYVSYH